MANPAKKIRVSTIRAKKKSGEKITVVTAHDALTAAMAQAAGIDIILVGDSLGMTSLGFQTTLSVTLEMMIHHGAAVARGASIPLLVGDMPVMTYKISAEQAMMNAGRMIQDGAMEALKFEGGSEMAETVRRVVDAGLPVMAHIGLMPQSVHAQGGFRLQGKEEGDAERLLEDAKNLEEAGAFCIVLEAIPSAIAAKITQSISIPTIGIGAGAECDGQVMVISDILGLSGKTAPKLAKQYVNLYEPAVAALKHYISDIKQGKFPGPENVYK